MKVWKQNQQIIGAKVWHSSVLFSDITADFKWLPNHLQMGISFGIKVLSGGIFTTIIWYLTGYAHTWLVSQVAMGLRHWSPVNWLATAHFPPAENNDHLLSTFKLDNCCFYIDSHRRSWQRSCWCRPQPAWETFIRWIGTVMWMRDVNKIMRLVMVRFLVDVLFAIFAAFLIFATITNLTDCLVQVVIGVSAVPGAPWTVGVNKFDLRNSFVI